MDNKNSEQEQAHLPESAILVFFGAGVAIVLFLLAGLWALLGIKYAFIAFLGVVVIGVVAWLFREADHHRMKRAHHKQEMHNQTHHRDLAAVALDRGYSCTPGASRRP
jgi:membrane protein implicated in regulation of membrane protease activity